ncbi:ABC transporter permease [Brevibacillus fulvus]|uniref:ABC-2 type transport system permease protein n=1 Tax=Brevibacillus fulvus TaxID=1125967 RepID=A0A939BRR6_9BACL|nr:ABC transporter permease [Brevibacillus fulvus]MBM7589922.1 ABC-2 type transport system permease protein [Brevibacillus fulvus]
MSSLQNLIKNEYAKLFKRKRTWLMFGSLVAINVVAGFVAYRYLQGNTVPIANRSLWGFVAMLQNGSILIVLYSLAIASSIVSSEFALGTIKFLMIRPVSRTKLLLSKMLTVLSLIILFYLTLFVCSCLAGGLAYGFSSPIQAGTAADLDTADSFYTAIKAYAYGMIETVMFAALAFMFSVLARSTSLAMGIALPLYMLGGLSNLLIAKYGWSRYWLFVNLDLEMYDRGLPFQAGMTLGFSLTVLAVYLALFVAISFVVFQKRDIV